MPGGDVTIALSGLPITEALQPGDWVTYDTSGLSTISFAGSECGMASSQSISPSSYSSGWRVVSNNGTTVKLISVSSVGKSKLYGNPGGSNFGQIMTRVCDGFKNSNLASSVSAPSGLYSTLSSLNLASPDAAVSAKQIDSSSSWKWAIYFISGLYSVVYDNDSSNFSVVEASFRPVITLRTDLVVKSGDGKSKATAYVLDVEN